MPALSGLDTAFLCLEHGARPMHLGVVLIFEAQRPVHPAWTAKLLADRAAATPALRRSVRENFWPPGSVSWTESAGFVAHDQVYTHRLREPGTPRRLTSMVEQLIAEPVHTRRPPWELHVISGLGGNRFAVLGKFHHALTDGAGLPAVAGPLLDDLAVPQQASAPAEDGASTSVVDRLRANARRAGQAVGIATSVLAAIRPSSVLCPITSILDGSSQRHWARVSLDADRLHVVRKQYGATVNDVVLSVIAGGLRSWLGQTGDGAILTPGRTMRAFIPVNTRGAEPFAGGNHISGYLCDLPVGEADPIARLDTVRACNDRNKADGPTRGAGAFPLAAQVLPAFAHRLMTPLAGHAAPLLFDTMVTNVPIPDIPLRLDGAALREVHPIAPLAPGQALSIAVGIYAGAIHIGVLTDAELLPGADRFGHAVEDAAEELCEACGDTAQAAVRCADRASGRIARLPSAGIPEPRKGGRLPTS